MNRPMPTLFSETMGAYFYTDWNEYFQEIIPLIPERTSVADVGCGRGGLSVFLQHKKGCKVTCFDYSEAAISICKDKGLDVHRINLNEHPTLVGCYDVILFSSSLESLLDPVEVLKGIKVNLKDGGVVIIWVPNFSFIYNRLAYLRGKNVKVYGGDPVSRRLGVWGYDDIQFFNYPSLERLLDKCGYEIITWNYHRFHIKAGDVLRRPWKAFLLIAFWALRQNPALFSRSVCVKARVRRGD